MRHAPVTDNNEASSPALLMCKDLKESNEGNSFIRKGFSETKIIFVRFLFLPVFPTLACLRVSVLLCFFAPHFFFLSSLLLFLHVEFQ